MPQITAFDGASTPVSHTLDLISVSREKGVLTALYREGLTTLPVDGQVSVTIKAERLKSGVYRQEMRVEVPVMETIGSQNAAGYTAAPKVAYVDTIVMVGMFHGRSSVGGRRLVRQLALNLAGNITTSVAPVTTGVVPSLIDQLIAPT